MKATLESTARVISVNGVPARVWEGKTEGGTDVFFAVCQVAAPSQQDNSELKNALIEHTEPSEGAMRVFPLHMVL
jgi:hypothetical protein